MVGIVNAQDVTPTIARVASRKQKGIKHRLKEVEDSTSTLNSPGWKASALRVLPGLQVTRKEFMMQAGTFKC